jgi:hypothetical protein
MKTYILIFLVLVAYNSNVALTDDIPYHSLHGDIFKGRELEE